MYTENLMQKIIKDLDKNLIKQLINSNLIGSYLREVLIEAELRKITVDPNEKSEEFK